MFCRLQAVTLVGHYMCYRQELNAVSLSSVDGELGRSPQVRTPCLRAPGQPIS